MILVDQLLYEIDFKLNKIATLSHQSIPLEDKIIALNDAQVQLIKEKININNVYKLGLDGFKKRYDDLQNLITEQSIILSDDKTSTNRFSGDISNLNPTYMFYVDGFILAKKGTCVDIPLHGILTKHADLWTLMNNSHTRPSFEYQETLITISENKIETYTDGSFTPSSINLMYVRYPVKIDAAGYEHFDGTLSIDQNCELPEYLKDELVDLAVQELAMSTENQNAFQYSQYRKQNNE